MRSTARWAIEVILSPIWMEHACLSFNAFFSKTRHSYFKCELLCFNFLEIFLSIRSGMSEIFWHRLLWWDRLIGSKPTWDQLMAVMKTNRIATLGSASKSILDEACPSSGAFFSAFSGWSKSRCVSGHRGSPRTHWSWRLSRTPGSSVASPSRGCWPWGRSQAPPTLA